MGNLVYHPEHYNHEGRKECWEEMYDTFGLEAVVVFDCLNAYKYLYRAGTKDGNSKEQDLLKAKNYWQHAVEFHPEEPLRANTYAYDCMIKLEKLIAEVEHEVYE